MTHNNRIIKLEDDNTKQYNTNINISKPKRKKSLSVLEILKIENKLYKKVYERHSEFSVEMMTKILKDKDVGKLEIKNGKIYANINGINVSVNNPKFILYNTDNTCVSCGLHGTKYAIERHRGAKKGKNPWHINFYAEIKDGNDIYEVMMTQDHIYPKSCGGTNDITNLQVMCKFCNEKKGAKKNHV
jgi:hypothetical protein